MSRPRGEMLAHVEALLGRHPRLQPLLESGWTLDHACDESAIWVVATRAGEPDVLEARLDTPRWWLPSRSGRALAIAEELATSLAARFESQR